MTSPNQLDSKELFSWRKNQLSKGGACADLDWLLEFGGGISWASLQRIHIEPRASIQTKRPLDELDRIWTEHIQKHVPLQYLVGLCPWRDFELQVTPAVLIPRQETELLVDFALDRINPDLSGHWADLGTGSGAIAVALARALPEWYGHAVDVSNDALILARTNLQRLSPSSVKWSVHWGSWWEPLRPWWGSVSLAVVNPPYIPNGLIAELDPVVRDNEPHLALSGGEDGLEEVKKVIDGVSNALNDGGVLCIEHHYDQSELVLELMLKAGLDNVEFEMDLEGVRRFAMARKPC
ncbi:peptide chain release factor N(5)-glutamine methyltransferase [Prochlorococcus sp. MIT 1341]|uniref:peptide chain release factor N(5)-glutamine methyltransferase n=1 Tax=Prochlorococcus sp. MIT 1341 TaxID=3096221 RepID=UPI002A757136|nr:peptide chain release factor N(5)-glutamine methyltransferase [Prochlorococcus sp. MIT 1341]